MQKVIYINAYGESIEFSAQPPVLLRSVSGFSGAEASAVSAQGAYQSGVTLMRLQLPARRVQVQFDILPQANREAFYAQRMRIERVLSPGRSMRGGKTGMLLYQNDAGRWQIGAVPDGGVVYGKRVCHASAENKVSFLCPNPMLMSEQPLSAQLRMGAGGFELPTALPIRLGSRRFSTAVRNEGTADTPVTVTIYGTGEAPALVNHTTGARLAVTRIISQGERLVIQTDPRELSCVLIRQNGETEDAFGYLDPSAAVSAFLLAPGVNELEYRPSVASAGSRVEIEWRSCYEGV